MTASTSARIGVFAIVALVVFAAIAVVAAQPAARQDFRSTFDVNKASLADRGQNTYFILEPGYRQHFRHGSSTLTISVLNDTKVVDGVTTRVVEERETEGGELAEVSRNYFAIDRTTGDVYYFGEDVDEYKNGKITGHEGAWLSGVNGARFGLMMPGTPMVGDRYYTEYAPKVAMDRVEIQSVTTEMKVAAGPYRNCLHTRESSAIERGLEDKWYAPGVGLIKDADFELVKIEKGKGSGIRNQVSGIRNQGSGTRNRGFDNGSAAFIMAGLQHHPRSGPHGLPELPRSEPRHAVVLRPVRFQPSAGCLRK